MNKKAKNIQSILRYLLVLTVCAIFLLPFIIMVTTSLKTNGDAFSLPVRLLPREFIWKNYPEALEQIPYIRYMLNTIYITAFSIMGQLFATPSVAYSLGKIKWKGSKYISALIMSTMMIPYTVTMIPLYKLWTTLGLANTYFPLIAPTFFGSAFYIIIMRQFFTSLPDSLFEAAEIDGANEVRRYILIALPLSKPALTTVGIYAFITAWSDYLAPLIYINKKEKLTLSLGLQGFLSQYSVDWTHLMAATTMFVFPVVIFFLIFQRNFVEGVASSGIKG
ncbi:MAG: carbohydrate ABC transporter permease [Lachnospirales bacterium]